LTIFTKNKTINFFIKLAIVALLAWVIYKNIFGKQDIDEIWSLFLENVKEENIYWLIFAILLMPVNWIFETLKWRVLIEGVEKLSFRRSFAAIIAGVTLSIFTPNRIGEYGGRVLFVKPENNWKSVIATLVGSFSQLLVILSMGMLGFAYFVGNYFDIETHLLQGVFFIMVALIGLMLFGFYNIDILIPVFKKIPHIYKLKRFFKHIIVLRNYDSKTLNKALGFAFLRYSVYTIQYLLLLHFFGINITLIEGLSGIATIFILQTSIPLPPLVGLLARSEIALVIWGIFSDNELSILASTFVLWILNLIIPALFGAVFIANINVLKSLGYDKKKN
jgi:hypothetical protein